jgi:hypothetical protein
MGKRFFFADDFYDLLVVLLPSNSRKICFHFIIITSVGKADGRAPGVKWFSVYRGGPIEKKN